MELRDILTATNVAPVFLSQIWNLVDVSGTGYLTKELFAVAMRLASMKVSGQELPMMLPSELIPPTTKQGVTTLYFLNFGGF